MPKFSVLVSTYNKEETIERCLESIFNQTYKDFEIIVVDDKSKDKTLNILKKYQKKIKLIEKQKNSGVSDTRNRLIKEASGKYFIFVDADDYIREDLLQVLDKNTKDEIDVVSFCMALVNNDKEIKQINKKPKCEKTTGQEIIKIFIENRTTFDTPAGYCYKKDYFLKNKFQYKVGLNYEDFGLTPLTILKASTMISLDYIGYYYVQTEKSITRGMDKKTKEKNIFSLFTHFDFLYSEVEKDKFILKDTKKIFYSFLANTLISRQKELDKETKKAYQNELKKRKIVKLLLANTPARLIKKIVLSININQ